MKRITCTACATACAADRQHCHECRGVGIIEIPEPNDCKHPIEMLQSDPMVGGWECTGCGASGY